MELRILMFVLRVLDPRQWRRRLLQLGGFAAVSSWVTVRAIQSSDEVRAVRDARHVERADAATATLVEREAAFRRGQLGRERASD